MADVRKELNFCAKTGVRVLGVVANMDGFHCASCGARNAVFPAPRGGGPAAMAARFGVPFLGALPLDPALLAACEAGRPYAAPLAASGAGGSDGDRGEGAEPAPSAAGVAAFNALAEAVVHGVEGPDAELGPWVGSE